jgi:hypothetical protein
MADKITPFIIATMIVFISLLYSPCLLIILLPISILSLVFVPLVTFFNILGMVVVHSVYNI